MKITLEIRGTYTSEKPSTEQILQHTKYIPHTAKYFSTDELNRVLWFHVETQQEYFRISTFKSSY